MKRIAGTQGVFCLIGIVLTVAAFAQSDDLADLEQRLQKAKAAEAQKQKAKQAAQRAAAARSVEQPLVSPTSRFVKVVEGVRDVQQNVIWAVRDNGSDINWSGAQSYCNGLGSSWTLPTSAELSNLYDVSEQYGTAVGSVVIRPATRLIEFTGIYYWSLEQNGPSEAWGISFVNGERLSGFVSYYNSKRALCVRRS